MEGSGTGLKDYGTYHMSLRETMFHTLSGAGIAALLGYLFYRSAFAAGILLFMLPYYRKQKKEELCDLQKQTLNEQFKEAMMAVSGNLRAGYSIENAFREAYGDMVMMYGSEGLISKELFYLAKGLDNNVILEHLLSDLGRRSGLDSIQDFAEIFKIAKRSGGDLNFIIYSCVSTICERIEVKKEIQTLIHAKRFEQKIMNMVPLGIIMYMQSTSPGFFNPLYGNAAGACIMTACLAVYLLAYSIARKITRIEV